MKDLQVLLLNEDVWENQRLRNGARRLKENAFVCVGAENGLKPIRTVKCFHFLPLEKDLCVPKVSQELNNRKQSMKDTFTSEGVTAHEKEPSLHDSRALPHFALGWLKCTHQSRAAV